ncbi:hypothetical protein D6856_13200 [Butyrivibrio sp. XB500-5]|uniref:hypothetical protein n=1 Tax=Butyrivibrio sp. XB500-5 TaxID=2364880 RepID=UPI000EA88732|nr:hypothetical protein [Butyrivibrio sp. XB500-5]RKM58699.1 hypothetical protein D6856_13200 [Butyrivibrio sp. XB500-5]
MANPVLKMNASAVLSKASTIEEISAALEADMKEVDAITARIQAATKGAFSLAYVTTTDEVSVDMSKHSKKVGVIGEASRQAVANTQAVDEQNASTVKVRTV